MTDGASPTVCNTPLSAEVLHTSSDIWVEDTGRWFAGADGMPNRAHGGLAADQRAPVA